MGYATDRKPGELTQMYVGIYICMELSNYCIAVVVVVVVVAAAAAAD